MLRWLQEKLEDTKGVINILKSDDRQHNGEKKRTKWQTTICIILYRKLNPLKTGDEVRYSGRVSRSWTSSCTRRVTLVTNPVISNEWEKDRRVPTTIGTYTWPFVTQNKSWMRVEPVCVYDKRKCPRSSVTNIHPHLWR